MAFEENSIIPYPTNTDFDEDVNSNCPPTPTKNSRRVLISNLPIGVSIEQVLRGVRGFGGIVSVSLFDTSKIGGQGEKSATVEFVFPRSATAFSQSVGPGKPLEYQGTEVRCTAQVWLVPARVDRLRQEDFDLICQGNTRCFKAEYFPVGAVWFLICVLGEKNIANASYDGASESLTLEFVSIIHSARAYRMLQGRRFPFYQPHHASVVSWIKEDETLLNIHGNSICGSIPELPGDHKFIPWVPPDQIGHTFERLPFNEKWPDYFHPVMHFQRLRPRSEEFNKQMYRLEVLSIARGARLSRSKWSWEEGSEHGAFDEASSSTESILSSMKNPRLGPAWSDFFKENQESSINLQRWEHYSSIAKHRRELCAEQGLPEGQIPKCHEGCEVGCVSIRSAPTSKVIRDYLKG